MIAELEELNTNSPLRLFGEGEGGLDKGQLGVVLARAGVGKTTFLVQVGLDFLLRGHAVLHVSVAQTVEHVQSRYDALFNELAVRLPKVEREAARAELARRRMITAFADQKLWLGRVEETAEVLRERLGFKPAAIIVDSCDWEVSDKVQVAAVLGGAKSYCRMRGIELWVSGQTHRETTGSQPSEIPPPCDDYTSLIDAAFFLEPHPEYVQMRVLKGRKEAIAEEKLRLDSDTMRLLDGPPVGNGARSSAGLPPSAFTLMSGGAKGAEAEFGRQAEAFGLKEANFTCEGRKPERTRNLVMLGDAELAQGAVSEVYLQAHMKRSYPNTELFKRTLQTIWHQVKTAGEVFVIGLVQDDGTVRGGTGWAAELARHWRKPVHVFDQEQKSWFSWTGDTWDKVEAPRITSRRFCGTGTRFLSDEGKEAIAELFARSFK